MGLVPRREKGLLGKKLGRRVQLEFRVLLEDWWDVKGLISRGVRAFYAWRPTHVEDHPAPS